MSDNNTETHCLDFPNWGALAEPETLYPVVYTRRQDGTKDFEPQWLKGKDLTEWQIQYLHSLGYFDSERLKTENNRRENSTYKNDQLRGMLEDVVNVLDLSEVAIEKHGPLGTPPAELVRLVLEEKNKQIRMLKAGMVEVKPFSLPNDSEVEKWFEENIGIVNDCSASSAIFKFRQWLRDRTIPTQPNNQVTIK